MVDGTYGPGSQFMVDTTQSFNVKTEFFVDQDADGNWTALESVKTTLSQGANVVTISQSCPGIFESIYNRLLNNEMSIAVSSYNAGTHSDISPTCFGDCSASRAKISNFHWLSNTSINDAPEPEPPVPGELIVSEEASMYLSECYEGCTECRKSWFENFPNEIFGTCVNDIVYRYGNQCKSSHDRSRCSTEEMDYCFKAYPYDSDLKWKDPDNKCRSVLDHVRDDTYPWTFANRDQTKLTKGLCKLGTDPARTCAYAWDAADPLGNSASTYLVRQRF